HLLSGQEIGKGQKVHSSTHGIDQGECICLGVRPRPVLRWTETGQALECVRESERIHIADVLRNRFDLLLCSHQLVCGLCYAHSRQLLARTAPEVSPAQAAQVLWTDIGQACKLFKTP